MFQSKYAGGDDVWRGTRYNRNYSFSALGGKEWKAGNSGNKWWSVNLRLTLMGGKKIGRLDEQASILAEEEISDGSRLYEDSEPITYNLDLTVSLRKNKTKYSSVWSLQMKNMFGSTDYDGYVYNYKQKAMVKKESAIMIPNLSYKIEF